MGFIGGFSVQNWSIFHILRSSDCSGKWLGWGEQKNSGSSKMGTAFANSTRTRGGMDKRSQQAHSACKTGLDYVFQVVLTAVQSG